ncbi:MAG: replication-associated recombination protein A [Ignavibacteria bacterium]|nr:replication-associated recombination protein A [Ignavibacteria bacterium]MBL0321930.1 replication-associated recombination protein A [Ignavibacteria bacterium]
MDSLFDDERPKQEVPPPDAPLAERMRPRTIEDVAGQQHLLASGCPLRVFVERGELPSMILWGPPGTGKTTLARVLTGSIGSPMERLSAVEAGVKDLRETMQRAERHRKMGRRLVLFIDEIHRFNKAQQDALLHAVERGLVTLIGATTENPSFEVNNALLSRCQVYRLQPLSDSDIRSIIERALSTDDQMKSRNILIDDWEALLSIAGGDARTALNAIEASSSIAPQDADGMVHITRDVLRTTVQRRVLAYDRAGDAHYDTVSAFIKSMRGSDPDAALLYLAVMIEAGEDPTFIARRMVIFASEDIGNADPMALQVALAVFQSIERIGMPEGRIPLAQGVTYLASAPKSNASYMAIDAALALIREGADVTIPIHLRNAPTRLMKEMGHGKDYVYPHASPGHFVRERYFPEALEPQAFYRPDDQGGEVEIARRLRDLWPERYS